MRRREFTQGSQRNFGTGFLELALLCKMITKSQACTLSLQYRSALERAGFSFPFFFASVLFFSSCRRFDAIFRLNEVIVEPQS